MGQSDGDAGRAEVRNTASGTFGNLTQIGTVGGGVHVHLPEPARQTTPRQLPAPPVPYVNQAGPLSMLDRFSADGRDGVVRVVVSGLPGSGRRGLVWRWAYASRGRFPGGQVRIDFAAFSNGKHASAGDASVAYLRALGVHEQHIPPTLEERLALVRSRAAARPAMLTVLENVREPALVSQFAAGAPGSAVLAVSGRRVGELHVAGAELVELAPLSTDDGMRLLAGICGQERVDADLDAARRVVELCGGLVLAIRIAAARLVTHRRLTVRALADELADERRRLSGLAVSADVSLSAAFMATYRELPAEVARFYRQLGAAPLRWFTVAQAAAAAGVDEDVADRWLDVLEAAHLLDVDATGRCSLHDLVRLHAGERAEREDPEQDLDLVVRRVADWLLVHASFADQAVMGDRMRLLDTAALLRGRVSPFQGDQAKEAALDWLDSERATFAATVRAAADHGLHDHVWQLAETLTALYFNRRYLADWIEVSRLGIAAARQVGRRDVQARLLCTVSRAYADRGDLARADESTREALVLAEAAGNLKLLASAWEFRGRYLDQVGAGQAVAAYERALEVSVAAGESRGAALARLFMAASLRKAGRAADALEAVRQAREAFVRLNDGRMADRAALAEGEVLADLGETRDAVATLGEAARSLRARKAYHYEAQALEAVVDLLVRLGDRADVPRYLSRVLEIHQQTGSPRVAELTARLAELDG